MLFQVTIANIAPTVAVEITSSVENEKSDSFNKYGKFSVIISMLQPKNMPKTITPTIDITFVIVKIFCVITPYFMPREFIYVNKQHTSKAHNCCVEKEKNDVSIR